MLKVENALPTYEKIFSQRPWEQKPQLSYIVCIWSLFISEFIQCAAEKDPLLLQILSSYLLLFRSSTVLNIKDDFFNCADK